MLVRKSASGFRNVKLHWSWVVEEETSRSPCSKASQGAPRAIV